MVAPPDSTYEALRHRRTAGGEERLSDGGRDRSRSGRAHPCHCPLRFPHRESVLQLDRELRSPASGGHRRDDDRARRHGSRLDDRPGVGPALVSAATGVRLVGKIDCWLRNVSQPDGALAAGRHAAGGPAVRVRRSAAGAVGAKTPPEHLIVSIGLMASGALLGGELSGVRSPASGFRNGEAASLYSRAIAGRDDFV